MQFHDFLAICDAKEGKKVKKFIINLKGPFSLVQDCDFTTTL